MSSTIVRFVNLRKHRTLHTYHPQRHPVYNKQGICDTVFGKHNEPISVGESGNKKRKVRRPTSAQVNGVDKYKRGEIFHSKRSQDASDRSWRPCKNPFLTNCKFRETIFCNHNHYYNISRNDIIAYHPIERDEGPTWIPPPPQKPAPPPKIRMPPPPKQVVVKVPEKPIVVKKEPPKRIPVAAPEKIKKYPYPKPGVFEKVILATIRAP